MMTACLLFRFSLTCPVEKMLLGTSTDEMVMATEVTIRPSVSRNVSNALLSQRRRVSERLVAVSAMVLPLSAAEQQHRQQRQGHQRRAAHQER